MKTSTVNWEYVGYLKGKIVKIGTGYKATFRLVFHRKSWYVENLKAQVTGLLNYPRR